MAALSGPAGLFALALARAGGRHGWSAPCRGLLHELREHPDEEVRDQALGIGMATGH